MGVIRRTGNKKRGRGRPNLTWEEFVKRDLNDWCITKELALDRREWKLAIHVSESLSSVHSFYCLLLSFLIWFFYRPLFFPSFSLLFCTFLAHVVSSLAYPNLLENKRLGCWLVGLWFTKLQNVDKHYTEATDV
jgi:hypothetical protein